MKKHIIHLLALCLAFASVSCNELLDMQSDGRISLDEAFETRMGVMGYLNSCYGYCPAPYMDRAALSDEAQSADDVTPGSRFSMWYSDAVTAANFTASSPEGANVNAWSNLYAGIRKCNVFLENSAKVDLALIRSNADEMAGWRAQAYALRALYYLQLVKRYGAAPILTEAYDENHDYSTDKRQSFSAVVTQILADCDEALSASETAFGWGVPTASFGIMTRAVPYAIKSQAVTYAASKAWTDGTYTWQDALDINAVALGQLLANDYSLFDAQPTDDAAQNPYALYFITSSNDQRSVDKETIYQAGNQMQVWRNAGFPTTIGMVNSGPCPSQELIDAYQTKDGQPVLNLADPYSDARHLQPNYNAANTLYNAADPYANRDPRFYASIYYNGSDRALGAAEPGESYPLTHTGERANINMIVEPPADPRLVMLFTGSPPYMGFTAEGFPSSIDWDKNPQIYFSFDYHSNDAFPFTGGGIAFRQAATGAPDMSKLFFFDFPQRMPGDGEGLSHIPFKAPDMAQFMQTNYPDWDGSTGTFFFIPFIDPDPVGYGNRYLDIINLKITIVEETQDDPFQPIYTYVGAPEGISTNDARHTRTGYYMRKFRNWRSSNSNNADGAIRLLRLGEMILNFAESAYQAQGADVQVNIGGGRTLSALDAVNMVRSRAGMPDLAAGLGKDEFERLYRNERRVELAFEEHRYFDVRRWGILGATDRYVTGMRITRNGEDDYSYERIGFSRGNWRSKYMLYPLDPEEVNKMIKATGTDWQNPDW